jgi:hypothetical protein
VAGHSLNCAASRASRRESALPKSGCAVDTARTPAPGANGGCRAPPRSAKQAPRTRNAMNGRKGDGPRFGKKASLTNFDSSRRAQAREVPARVHVLVHVTLPPQRSRACVSCLCLHGLQLHGLSLCRFLMVSPLEKVERAQGGHSGSGCRLDTYGICTLSCIENPHIMWDTVCICTSGLVRGHCNRLGQCGGARVRRPASLSLMRHPIAHRPHPRAAAHSPAAHAGRDGGSTLLGRNRSR